MSEIKVSQMQEATNLNDDDYLMVVQNGMNKKVKAKNLNKIQEILQLVFPIGSTYITQEDINPSEILKFGTWERLKGKVCLGVDEDDNDLATIGNTGGEKEHTLTIPEMPNHDHELTTNAAVMAKSGKNEMAQESTGGRTYELLTIGKTGGSQPHNNMQPYEVVGYMWIRRS